QAIFGASVFFVYLLSCYEDTDFGFAYEKKKCSVSIDILQNNHATSPISPLYLPITFQIIIPIKTRVRLKSLNRPYYSYS
ncbi:hypothetical protein, partial [Odoribacter splanchnicus]|uniref:hypothetical protein n=1 Tax=Odoribacter splanchnicus TaxID=28118 RepID=UPI0019D19C55